MTQSEHHRSKNKRRQIYTQIAIVVKSGGFMVEIGTSTFWKKS
jgi:hypothetical protein